MFQEIYSHEGFDFSFQLLHFHDLNKRFSRESCTNATGKSQYLFMMPRKTWTSPKIKKNMEESQEESPFFLMNRDSSLGSHFDNPSDMSFLQISYRNKVRISIKLIYTYSLSFDFVNNYGFLNAHLCW